MNKKSGDKNKITKKEKVVKKDSPKPDAPKNESLKTNKTVEKKEVKSKSSDKMDADEKLNALEVVKNSAPAKSKGPKYADPDVLFKTVIEHISSIVSNVRSIDDRKFINVTEIAEVILNDTGGDLSKLNRKDLKEVIEQTLLFLEDQKQAFELLKENI